MLLSDSRELNKVPTRSPGVAAETRPNQAIELIMVRVGNQPFGLLMKQVFNIARPEDNTFAVSKAAEPEKGRTWAEVLYRGKILKVLELARQLGLTAAEPLANSRILLSGKLSDSGNIHQPFGVSVDDIIGIWHVGLDQLRLLDGWVCRKRLGRLLWGVALMDRETLGHSQPAPATGKEILHPILAFNGMMGETGLLSGDAHKDRPEPANDGLTAFEKSKLIKTGAPAALPVMLLDLEVLRNGLYPY